MDSFSLWNGLKMPRMGSSAPVGRRERHMLTGAAAHPGRSPMPSTTYGAGDQTFTNSPRTRSANCAHLHSAFGPGCPYCAEAGAHAAPDGGTGSSTHERLLP